MEDLKTYEARTGLKAFAGLQGETECPGCQKPCPAQFEEWGEGVLLMTFECPCGSHLLFEDEAA